MKIMPFPEHWPRAPVEQQKEGLEFVLKHVSKKAIANATGLLVYRGMATHKSANQIWELMEEIEQSTLEDKHA